MRPARARRLDGAEMIAEPPRELRLEARCIEFEQAAREIGAFGPDDRRAMLARRAVASSAGWRRDRRAGTSPGRRRDAAAHGAPPARSRSGRTTSCARRCRPPRASSRSGPRPRRSGGRRGAGRSSAPARRDPRSRSVSTTSSGETSSTCGAGCEPAQQRGAQEAVLDDPAHRRRGLGVLGGLAMIEMEEEGARAAVVAGVGDPDVADRLGLGRRARPRRRAPRTGAGWCRRWRWCGRRSPPRSGRRAARGRSGRSKDLLRRPPGPAGCR